MDCCISEKFIAFCDEIYFRMRIHWLFTPLLLAAYIVTCTRVLADVTRLGLVSCNEIISCIQRFVLFTFDALIRLIDPIIVIPTRT